MLPDKMRCGNTDMSQHRLSPICSVELKASNTPELHHHVKPMGEARAAMKGFGKLHPVLP